MSEKFEVYIPENGSLALLVRDEQLYLDIYDDYDLTNSAIELLCKWGDGKVKGPTTSEKTKI